MSIFLILVQTIIIGLSCSGLYLLADKWGVVDRWLHVLGIDCRLCVMSHFAIVATLALFFGSSFELNTLLIFPGVIAIMYTIIK